MTKNNIIYLYKWFIKNKMKVKNKKGRLFFEYQNWNKIYEVGKCYSRAEEKIFRKTYSEIKWIGQ